MHHKDQAICVRVTDYSETSQILTFFTRHHGKLGAIAKGSKRIKSTAFGGTIELLSRGEILFTDTPTGKLATLIEFHPIYDVVSTLPRNLTTYYGALLGTELLTKLTKEHAPHPGLFEAFETFLVNMIAISSNEPPESMVRLLIVFQITLLSDGGIMPTFNACVNCRRAYTPHWSAAYFSSLANGLICPDCEMSFPQRTHVSETVIQTLSDLKQLSGAQTDTVLFIEKMLIAHFTELLHHRPKMATYICTDVPNWTGPRPG